MDKNKSYYLDYICVDNLVATYQGKLIEPWNKGHSDPHISGGQASIHTDSLSKGMIFIKQIVFKI